MFEVIASVRRQRRDDDDDDDDDAVSLFSARASSSSGVEEHKVSSEMSARCVNNGDDGYVNVALLTFRTFVSTPLFPLIIIRN